VCVCVCVVCVCVCVCVGVVCVCVWCVCVCVVCLCVCEERQHYHCISSSLENKQNFLNSKLQLQRKLRNVHIRILHLDIIKVIYSPTNAQVIVV